MSDIRRTLAEEIVREFVSAISGTNETQIVKYNPNDRIYVGKLSPQSSADGFSSSVVIKQISVDFRINHNEMRSAEIEIYPQGNFFYRVIPTYEQQKAFFFDEFIATFPTSGVDSFDDIAVLYQKGELNDEMAAYKVSLLPVYEKISIDREDRAVRFKVSDLYDEKNAYGTSLGNEAFQQDLQAFTTELCAEVKAKENIIPCQFRDKLMVGDLLTQESWESYKKRQTAREDFSMLPRFNFDVSVEMKGMGDIIDFTVALSNETLFGDESSGYNKDAAKNDAYRINTLFNSGLRIRCKNASFLPIELDYFEDDYKYDPKVYALGNNCNVDYYPQNMELRTNHVPTFVQKRLKTNDSLAVKFDDLINSPCEVLNDIYVKMKQEIEKWRKDFDNRSDLTESGRRQFAAEISAFEIEMKRFKTGVDLIEHYNMIRNAFVYMNRSFKMCAKNYDSWRLFQIVFIVSLILDIVAHEPELDLDDEVKNKAKTDDIDILFFPTGGGKTEAFLGILVFNLFFDRLRGKTAGVTGMIKYPLRLLSVQQVQRTANILAMAEIIRSEEGLGGERFSLGYFVGEGNTPNKIENDLEKELEKMTQDELDEKYRLIDVCPFCKKKSIHVLFDKEKKALRHICGIPACSSKGEIPLFMVDEDIYRSIPSVIISTVDKMTAIGMNMRFRNLLFGATYKCPRHGYTARNRCWEYGCECTPSDFEKVAMKDPAPTLLIQDELHLIKESLGTYDAHYETLIEYFVKALSGCKRGIKVIGATATISAYEIQAKHLYWKNAIRFPAASPYLEHNFYSDVDPNDTGRIIIGFAPFGKAIVNSVAYSLQYLKRVVANLYAHPEKVYMLPDIEISGSEAEKQAAVRKLLEDYWIILEYNNVKMESNRVLQAIEDPINTELIAEGINPLVAKKMTGDDSFQEVRSTLSAIEHARSVVDELEFNMIAATSMISHGVDADRFNLMLFYGMPGNTAEYIQAYSRVGRKYPGIVIDIMRPSREKDQSYLKNFVKFHEYKDIMVDAVSINRWASKAVENTLPGVISAILLNHYAYELQYTPQVEDISKYKYLKAAVQNGLITVEDMKQHAYQVYKCSDNDSSVGKLYKETIDRLIEELFDGLRNGSFDGKMYLTSVFEKCYFHVMQSLRDTDKQIIVEMK